MVCKHVQFKGYNARQLRTEFPNKGWTTSNTNRLLKKFSDTQWTDGRAATDSEVPAWMNTDQVNDMVLSQEDQPELTQHSPWNITEDRRSYVICCPHYTKGSAAECFKRRHAQELTEVNGTAGKLLLKKFFPDCRGLKLLYRWKDVHCGCSRERIVKIS